MYNKTSSVKFCFWFSTAVLACSFGFGWALIEIDSEAPDTDCIRSNVRQPNSRSGFGLPCKVWLLLTVGACLMGVTQGFTMILSGYGQRQFGYTNQEGGFLIVNEHSTV